jgi:hypothetical protein
VSAPPRDQRRSARWDDAAFEVLLADGWVRIAQGVSPSYVTRLRRGGVAAFRPVGRFEFLSRRVERDPVKVDLYARSLW